MENPFKFFFKNKEAGKEVLFDDVLSIYVRMSSVKADQMEELAVHIKVVGGFGGAINGRSVSIFCPFGNDFVGEGSSYSGTNNAFDDALNNLSQHLAYFHQKGKTGDEIAAFKFRLKQYIKPGIKNLKSQLPK